jgi:hypothetical protein
MEQIGMQGSSIGQGGDARRCVHGGQTGLYRIATLRDDRTRIRRGLEIAHCDHSSTNPRLPCHHPAPADQERPEITLILNHSRHVFL